MDGALRDEQIARIGKMVMDSPDGVQPALNRFGSVAHDFDLQCGPVNLAGRLIRWLQEQPLEMRESRPWVGDFIAKLHDAYHPKVHGNTPAWLPPTTATAAV